MTDRFSYLASVPPLSLPQAASVRLFLRYTDCLAGIMPRETPLHESYAEIWHRKVVEPHRRLQRCAQWRQRMASGDEKTFHSTVAYFVSLYAECLAYDVKLDQYRAALRP